MPAERALPGADHGKASLRPSRSRRSHASSPPSSGRSIARSPIPARRPGKRASGEEVARSQSFQGASAGAAAGNVTFRATAGAKPRQGNSRFLLVADRKIDARSQAQDSPRRTSGHAAQIRGSELDHRRLKASPLPLHDHNFDGSQHRLWREDSAVASTLDKGHQSKTGGDAPAGSSRSSYGGDEMAEAFGKRVTNW